jgi:hypothetical protein
MSATSRWLPSNKPTPRRPHIPWVVRSALPIDHPFIFLSHCWVIWFTADAERSSNIGIALFA